MSKPEPKAAEFEVVDLLIQRLTDGQAADAERNRPELRTPYGQVLGALEVLELESKVRQPKSPAAVVLPISEEAAESVAPRSNTPPQFTRMVIAVETLLKAPNDPTGDSRRGELMRVLGQSRALCAGWQPIRVNGERLPGIRESLQLQRGRLVDLTGAWLAWRDEYVLRWWYTGGTTPGVPARVSAA